MGLFDNVDWKDLKDKAVSATNKAIDVTKDAVESAKEAKAEADVKKQEFEAVDRVEHPEKYAHKVGFKTIGLEKVGFGSVGLTQTKAGIVTMGGKEYYLMDFNWNQQLDDKGKKWVGRAVVGTMVAGPLGTLVGAGTGKRKVEDNSTGVIILQEIKTGKPVSIQVKLDAAKATKMQSFIKHSNF